MAEQNDVVLVVANKRKTSQEGLDRTFLFTDCTMSIDHTFENEVTQHPLDSGSSVADHIILKNLKISIAGMMSNNQLVRHANDFISNQKRVQDAYDWLIWLRDTKPVFDIVSRYDTYVDCVVTSLKIPTAPDQGDALIFNLDVEQVRFSKDFNRVTLLKVEDVSTEFKDKAASTTNKGNKSTVKADGAFLQVAEGSFGTQIGGG